METNKAQTNPTTNVCFICKLCGAILIPPQSWNHNDHISYYVKSGWRPVAPDPNAGTAFHYVCCVCDSKAITLEFS